MLNRPNSATFASPTDPLHLDAAADDPTNACRAAIDDPMDAGLANDVANLFRSTTSPYGALPPPAAPLRGVAGCSF